MLSNTIPDLNGSLNHEAFDPLLAALSSELAFQVIAARYITVATLTVFIWDILINIFNDYSLLFERRIRSPTVIYFISRLCCLGFNISSMIVRVRTTIPIPTCLILERTVVILYCAVIVFTSLLFFFRTRAVFDRNPWIVAIFAGLWLAVLGSCLAFVVYILKPVKPAANPNATGCVNEDINPYPYVAATTIIPMINDTLVFFAITWRLSYISYAHHTLHNDFRFLVFGDYLPVFTKALLQDGQAYYLTIITVNLVAVVTLFDASIPDIFRTVFAVPNATLMNIMACQVFRNTKLFKNNRGTEVSTTIQFRASQT